MSQIQKSPVVMLRIERGIEDRVRGLSATEIARRLMEQGWIDIEWAAGHTRSEAGDPS